MIYYSNLNINEGQNLQNLKGGHAAKSTGGLACSPWARMQPTYFSPLFPRVKSRHYSKPYLSFELPLCMLISLYCLVQGGRSGAAMGGLWCGRCARCSVCLLLQTESTGMTAEHFLFSWVRLSLNVCGIYKMQKHTTRSLK
jgi:hypothetical protein